MNEYRRGFIWYATGCVTEQPDFLAASLLGSLTRLDDCTDPQHRHIWTKTALFYLGAILGQQARGIWSELVDGQEIVHTIA